MKSESFVVDTNQRTFSQLVEQAATIGVAERGLRNVIAIVRHLHERECLPIPDDLTIKTLAALRELRVTVTMDDDGFQVKVFDLQSQA